MSSERVYATSQRVWFITGCSSGFGNLFISAVVARGDLVIATARNISTMQDEAQHENVRWLQLDVNAPQNVLNEKATEALEIFGRVDTVVNNAGYVQSGVWEEISHEQLLAQFNTNVFGPLNVTRAFLPHMRSKGHGTVIFMSSISGWLGVAAGGPYSASKFALEGAVESLRKEIKSFGIETLLIVLGQFRTGILSNERRKLQRPPAQITQYDTIVQTLNLRQERTNGRQPGDPVKAVELILDAVKHEGSFNGQDEIPFRLVLGSDAFRIVHNECSDMLRNLDEYERLSKSTDIPGSGTVQEYI